VVKTTREVNSCGRLFRKKYSFRSKTIVRRVRLVERLISKTTDALPVPTLSENITRSKVQAEIKFPKKLTCLAGNGRPPTDEMIF
jgi:hypothetical protein